MEIITSGDTADFSKSNANTGIVMPVDKLDHVVALEVAEIKGVSNGAFLAKYLGRRKKKVFTIKLNLILRRLR